MRVPGSTAVRGLPRAHERRAALLPTAFRKILPIVTLFFVVSPFGRADDFWKQKPPAQWSHAEALRIVRHSPWAKVEVVVFVREENQASYSIGTGTKYCDPDALDASGHCLQRRRVRAPVDASRKPDGAPALSPSTAFLVRWESAIPVNQAFARLEELGERALAVFQAPAPRLPADRYVITVKLDQPGFVGFEPFAVTPGRSPYLRAVLKTSRGTVTPLEIEFSGTGTSSAVHFFFPRTLDGAPLLSAGRDTAEFDLRGAGFAAHSKFTLDPEFRQ